MQKLKHVARQYRTGKLTQSQAGSDPLRLFARWFRAAVAAGLDEPTAVCLATATPGGRPSARFVLLKAFDQRGFVFFTNYLGRKSREVIANPQAAMTFYWDILERQVRVEGHVERTSEEESDAYFRLRPRQTQLGAWASLQSKVISSRSLLERRFRLARDRFKGREVPRPPYWGGFRIVPERIEFWQGRANRLHDRIVFVMRAESGWKRQRLSP